MRRVAAVMIVAVGAFFGFGSSLFGMARFFSVEQRVGAENNRIIMAIGYGLFGNIPRANADAPYSQGTYYSQGGYYSQGSYDGKGGGGGGGCSGCSCGGCSCSCSGGTCSCNGCTGGGCGGVG